MNLRRLRYPRQEFNNSSTTSMVAQSPEKIQMLKSAVRVTGSLAVLVGLCLLARVVYRASSGTLAAQYFPYARGSWTSSVYALGLSLPVPFHIISVGLVVQKRWLPPFWARAAWFAVVVSGCWLGAALAVKVFIL